MSSPAILKVIEYEAVRDGFADDADDADQISS
jgi:hypothetical protein